MSNDVGYVLLGASLVPLLIGWHLAYQALKRATVAAEDAKQSAEEAKEVVAKATDPSTGGISALTAADSSDIKAKTTELGGRLESLNEAMKGMTGLFAPSGVYLAIAGLLITASIMALGVLEVSTGS